MPSISNDCERHHLCAIQDTFCESYTTKKMVKLTENVCIFSLPGKLPTTLYGTLKRNIGVQMDVSNWCYEV